jgi:hypothetical protein
MVTVYPAVGMVYNSMGAVWQKPTCGIPVLNPMQVYIWYFRLNVFWL